MEEFTTLPLWVWTILILVSLWELTWKAFALWRAAKNGDKAWYIILLIFNTAGILPIVYLFIISKPKSSQQVTA